MKKIVVYLLVSIMGIYMLAGCKADTEQTKQDNNADSVQTENSQTEKTATDSEEVEEVNLNIAYWADDKASMEIISDEFMKENPNVKINLMEFPSKDYETALAVQLAGGAEIDLFAMKNNAQYSDLATKGQTLSLNSFIARDKFDVSGYGPLYQGIKVNDEIMALPYRKTTWILYYNKNIFDAAGVDYPSDDMTWEEFGDLAAQVTSGKDDNKVWGAYLHTWPICNFGPALQTGATVIDEDLTIFADVLQMRLDLEKDGIIMPYLDQKATTAHYNAAFQKGNVAMNVIGDWHIQQLRQAKEEGNVDFEWDITSLPHPENVSNNTSWGMPTTMAINAATKNQEAAWKFLSYSCGAEGAELVASLGNLPGFMNDDITKTYMGDGSLEPDNLELVLQQKVYVEYPPISGINTIVNNIYKEEYELVFAGDQTPEEAIVVIKDRIQDEVQ